MKQHLPQESRSPISPEALDPVAVTMKGCGNLRGSETILLVEDEHMVSELAKRILERSGYTVLAATNGQEALSLYENQSNRISLVILDLIMPKMGGKECLEKLRQIDPNVKILVTSGHSVQGAEKNGIESVTSGFLYKPFSVKQMLAAVRGILDSD